MILRDSGVFVLITFTTAAAAAAAAAAVVGENPPRSRYSFLHPPHLLVYFGSLGLPQVSGHARFSATSALSHTHTHAKCVPTDAKETRTHRVLVAALSFTVHPVYPFFPFCLTYGVFYKQEN
uniref:Putative secreted peptide n=1 Tax=Anopheles braziliensis TaxID=58242 RepID=A0A2M3ZP09_9DIPT